MLCDVMVQPLVSFVLAGCSFYELVTPRSRHRSGASSQASWSKYVPKQRCVCTLQSIHHPSQQNVETQQWRINQPWRVSPFKASMKAQQIDRPNCFAEKERGGSFPSFLAPKSGSHFHRRLRLRQKRKGEIIINSPQFISGYFLCRILGKYAVMRTLCVMGTSFCMRNMNELGPAYAIDLGGSYVRFAQLSLAPNLQIFG